MESRRACIPALFIFVCARATDWALTGATRKKTMLIVSEKAREVSRNLLASRHRGATLLKGQGAWTGKDKDIIMTVCALTDVPRLKRDVFALDPEAFVVVADTLDVVGTRVGRKDR